MRLVPAGTADTCSGATTGTGGSTVGSTDELDEIKPTEGQ